AAKELSSATVTRVFLATSVSRSSLARPITGYATSKSGVPEPSITSASPTLATVRPTAPLSSWRLPTAGTLCVLVCGRKRRSLALAYSATRHRFRSKISKSINKAGVSSSEISMIFNYTPLRSFQRSAVAPGLPGGGAIFAQTDFSGHAVTGDRAFEGVDQAHAFHR